MPAASARVVVIGSGHAACQLAKSLVHGGYDGTVTLIGAEPGVPYSRPPLSKEYLAGSIPASALDLCDPGFFEDGAVRLHHDRATVVDRDARRVLTVGGECLAYDHLVLATGARSQRIPDVPVTAEGVVELRTRADADGIRARLPDTDHITVLGAGFVGMEFAAHAAVKGQGVTVVDIGRRALARGVTEHSAAILTEALRDAGVTFHFGEGIERLEHGGGALRAVRTTSGRRIPTQMLVVAAGVVPNTELASACGLVVNDGVVVDENLRTSDPRIHAIGDCARFPYRRSGRLLRLESVQNATDQAKCVANQLLGHGAPYDALAWFWTRQGPSSLQIAGVIPDDPSAHSAVHVLTDSRGRRTVFSFEQDRLVAVETFNAAAQHLAARAALGSARPITLRDVQTEGFDLQAAARHR
ncbi:NAD(P)/FAD-dependent oxidoreductase [Streptomyces sp. CA-249302]|uniref:NAD(P)/FAD-dependent oxidoreductase n=1 Tax=Streptomyces sp. CA-249302 TaxID=3240058 RepID=UPI003D89F034